LGELTLDARVPVVAGFGVAITISTSVASSHWRILTIIGSKGQGKQKRARTILSSGVANS
jgi:hypothetical protein